MANLTLSCAPCNQRKGNQTVEEFLAADPERRQRIRAGAQSATGGLHDAAAINTTRWALWRLLTATGLPVEATTGGRTKWNRTRLGIPKGDAWDAACAGSVEQFSGWRQPILTIRCTGRGSHQRTRLTADGFPRGYLTRKKTIQGFRTGDLARAIVPTGKHAGTYTGRVAVRATASFNIQTTQGTLQGIPARCCRLLQRADGYGSLLIHTLGSSALLRWLQANGVRASTEPSSSIAHWRVAKHEPFLVEI